MMRHWAVAINPLALLTQPLHRSLPRTITYAQLAHRFIWHQWLAIAPPVPIHEQGAGQLQHRAIGKPVMTCVASS